MAEQEVIKHTKKIFGIWGSEKGFWHKAGEFFMEIVIIVFAVTLSIYLHDRSVLKHQRHDTKEFLLGLKQDLQTDIKEMNDDKKSFEKSSLGFSYITSRKINQAPDPDSIAKYSGGCSIQQGLFPTAEDLKGLNLPVKLER